MSAFFRRAGFAFKCFFLILFSGRLPAPLPDEFVTPTAPAESTTPGGGAEAGRPRDREDGSDRAIQLLSLLQRDGRLLDFLFEDLSTYPDDQVGAAAREVHASCGEVIRRYLTLEPVLDGPEGGPATVDRSFEPGLVKLVGQVVGGPPFRGVLRHHGWRVTRCSLPALPGGAARLVVAPAEVEIG
jgi:hypothetical protein